MSSRPLPPGPNDLPPHVILEEKLDEILRLLRTISESLGLAMEKGDTAPTNED